MSTHTRILVADVGKCVLFGATFEGTELVIWGLLVRD